MKKDGVSHQILSPNSGRDVATQKENGRACPQDDRATVATSTSVKDLDKGAGHYNSWTLDSGWVWT